MAQAKHPLRMWALTINSPHATEDNLPTSSEVGSLLKRLCKSYAFSKEIGSQGRYHYQCVINLLDVNRTRNPASMLYKMDVQGFDFKYWEFQPCTDYRSLQEYCAKNPVDGIVCRYNKKHVPKQYFVRRELNNAQLGIQDCIKKYADKRSVFIFCNPEGNIGKTEYVKQLMLDSAVVFGSSVGSCDAIANQCVRDLSYFNNDPSISQIYLLFDITKTSPFLYRDRLNQLASIMESAVSGILVSSFGTGKSHRYYADSGHCIPVIFTNEYPQTFDKMFSKDRVKCFIYRKEKHDHSQKVNIKERNREFDKWFKVF